MKYISIGNSDSSNDILDSFHLNEYDVFYPFDNAVINISVIKDIISNDWQKYLDFDNVLTDIDNQDLIELKQHYLEYFNGPAIANSYQSWVYFSGIALNTKDDAKYILQKRIDEFNKVMNSNEDVTFIFTNHPGLSMKIWRDNQSKYYQQLLELIEIIKTKYNKTNFQVLAFFINESFTDTQELKTYDINMPAEFISDNNETSTDDYTGYFRTVLKQKFKEVTNL